MEESLEFYIRRAIEERRAADRSLPPEARKTHLAQAQIYMEMAREAVDERRSGQQAG